MVKPRIVQPGGGLHGRCGIDKSGRFVAMRDGVAFVLDNVKVSIENDLLFLKPHGALTLVGAREFCQLLIKLHKEHGAYFVLVDLNDAAILSAEVRRELVACAKTAGPAAGASFGGGLLTRAANALLYSAVKLVSKNAPSFANFATREQAEAWFQEERRRIKG